MPNNLTVDDYSPLIQYNGQWLDSFNLSLTLDPFARRYRDNSFHSSLTNGSTATFSFKGTAVYIFGAKRGNHGFYHVSVDGGPGRQFDGFAGQQPDGTDGVYQVPLFARENLADAQHTVTLTNIVNGQRPYVDIDYITWTQQTDVSFNSKVIEDSEIPTFQYSTPTTVWTPRTNADGFRSSTAHSTTTYGAAASLTFEGSEVFLYGSTGPNHGQFKVQLDNQQALELNGTAPVLHTQTLLYTTSGLAPGQHQLVITNLGDNKVMDVDFAEVVPTKPKSGITGGAIAGMVVGIVVGLALITLLLWYFFIYRRRKNKRRFSTDLMAASDDSQTAAMRSYSNNHHPMVVEPFVDNSNPAGQNHAASSENGGGAGVMGGRSERSNSQSDIPGRWQNQPKGAPIGAVNRGTDDPGLRPEALTSEGGSSGSRTAVETDAGALPPMYDQIESSRVADLPVRI